MPGQAEQKSSDRAEHKDSAGDMQGECEQGLQKAEQTGPVAKTVQGQPEQMLQKAGQDPYIKAWEDWKERYEREKVDRSERLEKKEKLENSWNLVKVCGEIFRENYSNWQERKLTEDERKELMEIRMEKDSRLKRQSQKMAKYQEKVGKLSKEEVFLKRMEMKEIKENIWVQRGATNSHEDHTKRMEMEKKKEHK